MNIAVLSDFDGTITIKDTGVLVLERFADGDWEKYDAQLMRGEVTLEECMQKQISMVNVSENIILNELESLVIIRNNFRELVDYCKSEGIEFFVVSGGLDFVIKHFLQKLKLGEIKVFAAKTSYSDKGFEFELPLKRYNDSLDFKDDLVRFFKSQGFMVTYIGNGISDFQAVKNADFRFSVKNSKLAVRCRELGVSFTEFTDFSEVIDILKTWK